MSALHLDAEPRSVGRARQWVAEELATLGREDLVDSAALGVSELVTNALLHAVPPIQVRLGGTSAHPRVEVRDCSRRPPLTVVSEADDEEDRRMRTFGRGIGLVSLYSTRWGAELSDAGKVVWFEPAPEPSPDVQTDVFDLGQAVEKRLAEVSDPPVLLVVRLNGLPVAPFAAFRRWYAEIRRELRLLALAHPDDYPIAAELEALILQVEQERSQARGVEQLDRAIAEHQERVDLVYRVPPTTPETMRRLADVLERVDGFCRRDQLLAVPEEPLDASVRRWYFAEFTRQGQGLPPLSYDDYAGSRERHP